MNLSELKTTDLRKVARDLEIKGMSSANKATLIPAIEAKQAEFEAIAKPSRMQSRRCVSCETRPATKESPEGQLCKLCLEEAGWENTHSDQGHEEMLKADEDSLGYTLGDCWICHPELNRASAEYVAKRGTSRIGQVMHVTLRASGEEKAAQTIAQLSKAWTADVTNSKGVTYLRVALGGVSGTMVWDAQGRTTGGTYTVEGKTRKIRNVAELLRLAS
jgi:hypothetical protein